MIKTESALWPMHIGRGLLVLALFLSCSSLSLANPFCLEGDCEDGVGKMPVPTGGYIVGRFYKGKMSGFAFQMLTEARGKEMFCETNMAMGKVSGVQHCYASQLGAHVFMYPKVNGRTDGRTILVAPNGDVISHKVYESGKEITLELYESDKAAVRDGKTYLLREVIPLLGERRRNRDKRIDAYVKSALWDIPGFKLSGGSLLDSSTPNTRVPIKRPPTSPSAIMPSTPKPKKPDQK